MSKLCYKAGENFQTPNRDATDAERRVFRLLDELVDAAAAVLDEHGEDCLEADCWICDDSFYLYKTSQLLKSMFDNYRVLEPIPEPESDTPVILEQLG